MRSSVDSRRGGLRRGGKLSKGFAGLADSRADKATVTFDSYIVVGRMSDQSQRTVSKDVSMNLLNDPMVASAQMAACQELL